MVINSIYLSECGKESYMQWQYNEVETARVINTEGLMTFEMWCNQDFIFDIYHIVFG